MNPEEYYYPIPPTKTQKAVICRPEEVQAWKDENQTLKVRITELETDLAREVYNNEAFMSEISKLVHYIADLNARAKALKEIAVEGWAVAEFGGEQEGQDYHLNFRTWNIDRESYRKEALELLQAEHPEVFR